MGDGGDCCGSDKNYAFCKACKCLDCTFKFKSDKCTDKISGICGSKNFVGDGFCDDNNNNAGCTWDGGDCCGSSGKANQLKYCKECKCKDCEYKPKGDDCVSVVKGACGKPAWKGDKTCDDDNNNAGCNWDGGDCCGANNYDYCKACKCLDCTFSAKKDACTDNIIGSCKLPNFQGDGVCDDENNNAGCNWDKGDCCGSTGNPKQNAYCKDCKCRNCEYKEVKDECSGKVIKGSCGNTYVGDGTCDDVNNNAGCNWDDGDCCGASKIYQKPYCIECKCKDCKADVKDCPKKNGKCGSPNWKGDKNCDDENNNCGCGWDGGDCCGKKNNYKYCKKCECLEPDKQECNAKCGSPSWTNDGICDDNNNNCGCGWDKGDCCGDSGKEDQRKHCKECKCLDPNSSDFKKDVCLGECSHPNWAGDGVCDGGNNNCGCEYDKGDCCGDSKNPNQFKFCKVNCKCVDPKAQDKK